MYHFSLLTVPCLAGSWFCFMSPGEYQVAFLRWRPQNPQWEDTCWCQWHPISFSMTQLYLQFTLKLSSSIRYALVSLWFLCPNSRNHSCNFSRHNGILSLSLLLFHLICFLESISNFRYYSAGLKESWIFEWDHWFIPMLLQTIEAWYCFLCWLRHLLLWYLSWFLSSNRAVWLQLI